MNFLKKQFDALIYLFIGPFTILYITPLFFRKLESNFFILPKYDLLVIIGVIFMNFGAVLAIICSLMMFINKYGSAIPFVKPTKLVNMGPYKLVRHPMMWALFFVLIGESLAYSSLFTVGWLVIWARFSYIYIHNYEEPFLNRHFGQEYIDYTKKVPRWIPFTKPN